MATWKFEYPDSASPTVTVTFTKGYTYPVQRPSRRLQARAMTAGGQVNVADYDVLEETFVIVFDHLPKGDASNDYAALKSFFENTVKGTAKKFDWIDLDSTVRTVRFMNEELNFQETDYQRYAGQLILRVEPS